MATAPPVLWLIAGPNGVGKTTYAFRHVRAVSGSVHFVNLDEIARGLSPLAPDVARIAAARVALARIDELVTGQASFSLETTLAGRTYLGIIERARRGGFAVNLMFFTVADVGTCIARIARRVSEGGHQVPEADARRRYARAHDNFAEYASSVDLWRVLDANGPRPFVVAEGRSDCIAMLGDTAGLPASLARTLAALTSCRE